MTWNCGRCDRTIHGRRPEHCACCHETFNSTQAGDLHRVGDHALDTGPDRRRCRTPAELLALRDRSGNPRVKLDRNGQWSLWCAHSTPWELCVEESDGLTASPEGDGPARGENAGLGLSGGFRAAV